MFRSFAKVCPLGIVGYSIARQNPPRPDIVCRTRVGEAIDFEITEAIDPDGLVRVAQRERIVALANEVLLAMPEVKRSRIQHALRDANVSIAGHVDQRWLKGRARRKSLTYSASSLSCRRTEKVSGGS